MTAECAFGKCTFVRIFSSKTDWIVGTPLMKKCKHCSSTGRRKMEPSLQICVKQITWFFSSDIFNIFSRFSASLWSFRDVICDRRRKLIGTNNLSKKKTKQNKTKEDKSPVFKEFVKIWAQNIEMTIFFFLIRYDEPKSVTFSFFFFKIWLNLFTYQIRYLFVLRDV